MGTCTTTSTNPDKIAYQKRSDARKRAKLTQSFRHSNACTKSHKHERQEGGPIDDTLFQDDDPHHQAAAETLETRVPRQKAQVRRMTLVPRQSARPKPRSESTTQNGRPNEGKAIKRTRHLINTKRKQANRSIGGATRQTSYRALQHPVTRVITDDATQMASSTNTTTWQAALRRETRHVHAEEALD
jgi:hypothetical protein